MIMSPVAVAIALGANQGERRYALQEAVRRLQPFVEVEHLSGVYETEPAYVTDQPRYLNMVLTGTTQLSPDALLAFLKKIEHDMGRLSGMRWGPRPIDLDILLYGDLLLDSPDLVIPHARLTERRFVLEPLAELMPDLVVPGTTKTVAALAREAPPIGEIVARLGPLNAPVLDHTGEGSPA
jgi:2-amino-4-hydroxy-6-hydroxymethyldihydropteridine diphosphokinase